MVTRSILIIDDDDELSEAIQAFLEFAEFRVARAGSGAIGLAMARETRPDLILLDWQMPFQMSGSEVLTALRADTELDKIPVIVMSARAEAVEPDVLGRHRYVRKPFSGESLVELVNRDLRHVPCSNGSHENSVNTL